MSGIGTPAYKQFLKDRNLAPSIEESLVQSQALLHTVQTQVTPLAKPPTSMSGAVNMKVTQYVNHRAESLRIAAMINLEQRENETPDQLAARYVSMAGVFREYLRGPENS